MIVPFTLSLSSLPTYLPVLVSPTPVIRLLWLFLTQFNIWGSSHLDHEPWEVRVPASLAPCSITHVV